ncbi:MAG: hypothetical protein M9895_04390 [Aquamicrobium sp.]|uniref:DUF7873 family protein n=1 Tax=Aquamicrobium sp. TaxID=1872579 RepID=UPI00349EA72C|nr:hypothetical protein [Aquamicrobium sp.]MCO5157950.1 hypothetical protein [Aquamicrobium sp.]
MAEKKPTQLHALLAVEADLTNTAKAVLEETVTTFAKKPDHFRGHVKAVTYFNEARVQENEREEKKLVTTVDDKLEFTLDHVARLYDALLQKEEANQRAKIDLVIDGEVIGTDLPATFLLGLENRLKSVHQTILTAPTLDPSLIWEEDQNAGEGVYRSTPQVSKRTEKDTQFKVLAAATDKHPAQIEKWTVDVPVAKIETTHVSGMWTPAKKAEVLARVDKLMNAVKKARQMANTVEVDKIQVGQKIKDYLLGA